MLILSGTGGWARIGDTPEQMAARMLQPNVGRNFSWPKEMNEREVRRAKQENPLFPFLHLLPPAGEDWREQMFWKSALRKQLSNENGWQVHVYYLKGRSAAELYRRVGAKLSDAEVNAILSRLRGGLTWRRVTKKEDEPADTVLGYEFELGGEGETSLRARQQGDWLIIFHRRFDEYLAARKARWDETEAQRKAEQREHEEQAAPASVDGF